MLLLPLNLLLLQVLLQVASCTGVIATTAADILMDY
jgi:hypothetical protein